MVEVYEKRGSEMVNLHKFSVIRKKIFKHC